VKRIRGRSICCFHLAKSKIKRTKQKHHVNRIIDEVCTYLSGLQHDKTRTSDQSLTTAVKQLNHLEDEDTDLASCVKKLIQSAKSKGVSNWNTQENQADKKNSGISDCGLHIMVIIFLQL